MKIRFVFVAFAVFFLFSFTVLAADAKSKERSFQEGVLSEDLQEKESIAIDKYNKLLLTWAYDPKHPSDTNADFPSFYGGSYLDANKELIIMVTILNEEIERYFSEIIDMTDVRLEIVNSSYSELLEVHRFLFEYIFLGAEQLSEDDILLYIYSVDIAHIENAVIIEFYEDKMAEKNISTDELASRIKDIVAMNMGTIYKDVNYLLRPGEGVGYIPDIYSFVPEKVMLNSANSGAVVFNYYSIMPGGSNRQLFLDMVADMQYSDDLMALIVFRQHTKIWYNVSGITLKDAILQNNRCEPVNDYQFVLDSGGQVSEAADKLIEDIISNYPLNEDSVLESLYYRYQALPATERESLINDYSIQDLMEAYARL